MGKSALNPMSALGNLGSSTTLMGGLQKYGDQNLLSPEQQSILQMVLSQAGPGFAENMAQQMQPMSQEDMQSVFQQSYVDPAMQVLNRNILPAIQERMGAQNAGSSSALNQALAQAAADASTSLGSQYGNFVQGQQGRQLQALGLFNPLLQARTFEPMYQQREGLLGGLLKGGAGLMRGMF